MFSSLPDLPWEDLGEIGSHLASSATLVPGYPLPTEAAFSPIDLLQEKVAGRKRLVILPDRNVVSRMARIAQDGISYPPCQFTRLATMIMAFAQALDIEVEPSIAFHELAHRNGNEEAQEELTWFRAADEYQVQAWIDMAMGRIDRLPLSSPSAKEELNLAKPLKRWRCNYLAALKISSLSLTNMSAAERVERLLEWMEEDFIFAGPAAVYAVKYFSPNGVQRRMIKHLRSPSRDRALAGIRNAAWDMTYISDFVDRINKTGHNTQNILVTSDRALADVAELIVQYASVTDQEENLEDGLATWWPEREARIISAQLVRLAHIATTRPPPEYPGESTAPLTDWISEAEERMWKWAP
ncbi:hypothetical protein [Devosia sp. 2618]|uniref:hypothetical protein n=1 Tax=Devosia sp. 2618 TaxID=3156454 RepID=UPI0033929CBF